jgi:hypothetical protein
MLAPASLSTFIGSDLSGDGSGRNRQLELGKAIHHSATDTENVDDRSHP